MSKIRSFIPALISLIAILYCTNSFAISLSVPLNCKYGVNCFISSYFDNNPKKNKYYDYKCGNMTADNKKSTDFVLNSYFEMKKGVYVLATEKGIISAVRKDMEDVKVSLIGKEAIRSKECGNAIRILHNQGYETEYCHLMKNSILVKKGQKVVRGQKIAKIGLSGDTDFPFLEFFLKKDNKYIDPFVGDISENSENNEETSSCKFKDIFPLWNVITENTLKYIGTVILSYGFSDKVPNAWNARNNYYNKDVFYSDSNFIAFWADILDIKKNDIIQLEITDADSKQINYKEYKFTSNKEHSFSFTGEFIEKKWKSGKYTGTIKLLRKNNKTNENKVIINKMKNFYIKKR